MCFWPYPVFEAVEYEYDEIQQDTARYSWIQLDTYGYSWIQWDTAGYSGSSAAKLLDTDRYRNTAGYQGYGRIQAAGYRCKKGGGHKKKYTPGARGGLIIYVLYLYIIYQKKYIYI